MLINTDSQPLQFLNMKYSVHSTQAEAIAENQRLKDVLGIPDGKGTLDYAKPIQASEGWLLELSESGPWKADHIAANVQEIELASPEEIA